MPVVTQVIMWGMAGIVWLVVLWLVLTVHGQWAANRRTLEILAHREAALKVPKPQP